MRFRALGPLRVVVDGNECDIPAPRQRTVLAVLLLERNRLVPLPRLIDAIWADAPPATARSQVQICVSALRRLLLVPGGGDAIRTRSLGYELVVAPGECDLDDLDRMLTGARAAAGDGHPSAAVETYRAALGLWRGGALSDVDSALVHAAVLALQERRLAATEELIDLELALGRHEEASLRLASLVPAHPLREGLRWRQMVALHRCGRSADALEAYADLRRTLVDQLGIEPGQRVRDLQRAILAGDPAIVLPGRSDPVAAPGPTPRLLPPAIAVLTGRSALAAVVRDLMTTNHASTVVVTGAAGVGKTALAVWVGQHVARTFPDGQLYAHVRGTTGKPASAHRILGRFLGALGVVGKALPTGLDERTDLFRSLIAGRRLLILVDDVTSEQQILPLIPGSAGSALMVTSRGRLPGLADARRVEVDVLDDASGLEMLAAAAGRDFGPAERVAARRLVAQCGGLPLVLGIAAARLAARPHWTCGDLSSRLEDDGRRLDELAHGGLAVRSSLSLSYEILTADARRLLRLLSVLDVPDVGGWVAAPLLDTGHPAAVDILETLVDARLVEAVAGSGVTRFRLHDLVRCYARERLAADEPGSNEAALRRMLGCLLHLTTEAHRRGSGGDYPLPHVPAPCWRPDRAVVDGMLADPLDWLGRERAVIVEAVALAVRADLLDFACDLASAAVCLFERLAPDGVPPARAGRDLSGADRQSRVHGSYLRGRRPDRMSRPLP